MNSLEICIKICMAIVEFLTIATCALYARTKKYNSKDNIPVIVRWITISTIITIYGAICPEWWQLAIICYILLGLFIWGECSEIVPPHRNAQYKGWYKKRSYEITKEIFGWILLISESLISIIMMSTLNWSTIIICVFSPILAISSIIMGGVFIFWIKED